MDNTLMDLWEEFMRWVATQPGVTEVEDVAIGLGVDVGAGSYYGGFLHNGVGVSVTMGYTE